MAKITGIGGVFFKAKDPKALAAWYAEHLGVTVDPGYGGVTFAWDAEEEKGRQGATVWAPFAADTAYFDPSEKPFMINYRVDDLDAVLAKLRAAGARVDDKIDDEPYGRFGWAMDPEGNRFELWEPAGSPA